MTRVLIVQNTKSYFPYLEAKGFWCPENGKTDKRPENTELHGNVTQDDSRSRAGSICQTRQAYLVVSSTVLGILLSSVFGFWLLTLINFLLRSIISVFFYFG